MPERRAEAKVAAVLALHFEFNPGINVIELKCHECYVDWPCATARACGVTE